MTKSEPDSTAEDPLSSARRTIKVELPTLIEPTSGARRTSAEQPRRIVVDEGGLPTIEMPGRYQDEGLLGRGGMGAVRGLRDEMLRRVVAAKTLDRSLTGDAVSVQSFLEEAQITAQLDHPNIVPVHELGTDRSGNLYFTMKRVRGRTLHSMLAEPPLAPGSPQRLSMGLEVFLKVCDALAFAHSRGVLHRDIKPDNIMVGSFGEVYLMDWGLAKVFGDGEEVVDVPRDPNSALARSVEVMVGTPAFMAPEMAKRQFDRVDERTDVFGLGAVLYQVVTGRLPYVGKTVEEAVERAKTCDSIPPDEVSEVDVPRKLARVIAKAMALAPEDRYASVQELARQVREFLHRGHHLPRVHYPQGTVIVREGDPCEDAYILTRGQCEVYRVVAGEKHVLRQMGPGSVFGESAVLGPAPRSASVVAMTDVTALVLTRELLDERLAADTWEGLLTKTLIERFRELDATLAELRARDRTPP